MPPSAAGPVEAEFRMSVRKQHTAAMGEKNQTFANWCRISSINWTCHSIKPIDVITWTGVPWSIFQGLAASWKVSGRFLHNLFQRNGGMIRSLWLGDSPFQRCKRRFCLKKPGNVWEVYGTIPLKASFRRSEKSFVCLWKGHDEIQPPACLWTKLRSIEAFS